MSIDNLFGKSDRLSAGSNNILYFRLIEKNAVTFFTIIELIADLHSPLYLSITGYQLFYVFRGETYFYVLSFRRFFHGDLMIRSASC